MDQLCDDFIATHVKIEVGNDYNANAADEDISDAAFEALLRDLGITNEENVTTNIIFEDLKVSAVKLDDFTCVVCNGDVDTHKMIHLLKHAKDSADFICDFCFGQAGNQKSKGMKCSECDKDFSSLGNLAVHIDVIHRKLKRFECNDCHYAFPSRSKLKTHMSCVHEKVKKYNCHKCNSTFSRQTHLRRHVAFIHQKAKLNIKKVCSDCDRSFSNSDSLKRHFKAAHLEVKYVCDDCGVKFIDRSNLVVHLRSIHQRLKPFVCGRCSSAFGDRSTLRKHQKSSKCYFNQRKK